MYDVRTFPKAQDVAAFIGRKIGQKLGCRHMNISTANGLGYVWFIQLDGEGQKPRYLNLYTTQQGDNWKVSAIGLIADEKCFTELTEKESEKLWKFGTSYIIDGMCYSLCDISGIDDDTIASYVTEDGSPEQVIVDKSVTAKRQQVSVIINNWFEIRDLAKEPSKLSKDMKQFLLTHNMRTEVVETIAQKCMEAMRCVRKNVAYNGSGTELKATVSLLSHDNRVYNLYLVIDEEHVVIYYMAYENGQWVEKLLPDSIGDVISLFMEKTR